MTEGEASFQVNERRRFADAQSVSDAPETAPAGNVAATETTGAEASSEPASSGPHPGAGEREPAANEPDDAKAEQEELGTRPDISASAMIQFTMASLAQMAWQNMGLLANPSSGKIEIRLADARLAIDAFAALVPVLNPRLEETMRREMQTLLSNLRLNFVEQTNRKTSNGNT